MAAEPRKILRMSLSSCDGDDEDLLKRALLKSYPIDQNDEFQRSGDEHEAGGVRTKPPGTNLKRRVIPARRLTGWSRVHDDRMKMTAPG
ncbi:MAG: hypothetical protein JJU18_09210 [Oceanicaulis sp.]|nr:hypothetical protein [Oceanicaulis sp.]